ncbi:MAG TPA: multicopper oxidase domain-containing protein [Spirillospora sp.]|nr:multicopper oxidase domain-containing protein [Spirillospora sp.]
MRLSELVSRRKFLRLGLGSAAALLGGGVVGNSLRAQNEPGGQPDSTLPQHAAHHDVNSMLVGQVDHKRNLFDPMQMLVDWDYGKVSTLPNGQALREYNIFAADHEIEIAPGIFFPAWTFNARVPGPSLRCVEGDRIRIHFTNVGTHPHTLHFHGIHTAEMDGVPGVGPGEIGVGGTFVYEFDAEPFGCHLYHCHAQPLKRHIHKGLYGAFIIDPPEGRPPAREFMMMMNAFDTNFDGENEIYAVNTVGHEYARRPIPIKVGELVRIYLINITEFDPINSFHLHAEFFDYYDHGTTLTPTLRTVDTIMQVQAQRGILEFRYRWPGQYMFHAHVSEFAELGWMGFFNAVEPENFEAALAEVGLDAEWDRRGTQGSAIQVREGVS